MGLYQSELSKQIHLRKMQKREWDGMLRNISQNAQQKLKDISERQRVHEEEEREGNLREIDETNVSKKLASAMVKSSLENWDDTMQRAVDLLQNQNGKFKFSLLTDINF